MIYFTADLHLDHAAIIGYCNRPFHSAAEMNGVLIGNILETVGKTDTLYVLGDFAFDPKVWMACADSILSACPDTHFFKGNHDPKRFDNWDKLPLALDFKHNKRRWYLCHYPWATWRPNTVMLHGHSHGNPLPLPADTRQHMRFDVGVDTEWDGRKYYPVSIEAVERRISNHYRTNRAGAGDCDG